MSASAGTAELTACLTLVAPSGMSAEDRNAWLRVARETLRGMPADLLAKGCAEARKRCRFASEIVPTIMETVEREWFRRKRALAEERAWATPRIKQKEDLVDPAEVRKLIASIGK